MNAPSLPEALLLFALHDERGTVHPSAFIAIDHGLRAAILAELRLQGFVQTKRDGQARRHPDAPEAPDDPLLAEAWMLLVNRTEPGPAVDWLKALTALPSLRMRIARALADRGVLRAEGRHRTMLPDQLTFPLEDPSVETDLIAQLQSALAQGDRVMPRDGTLLGLTVVCHLEPWVFGDDAEDARARARWVADRDAIVRALSTVVKQAETWGG
ncbi:MAG: GPP34 family phosphoprotein [Myxococcota bacterium]